MDTLEVLVAISTTVRLPPPAWLEEYNPLVHHSHPGGSLLPGRWTCHQAVMVIRAEGSFHEDQEALYDWACCGFAVEKCDRSGIQDPLSVPWNHNLPAPLIPMAVGAPPGDPAASCQTKPNP